MLCFQVRGRLQADTLDVVCTRSSISCAPGKNNSNFPFSTHKGHLLKTIRAREQEQTIHRFAAVVVPSSLSLLFFLLSCGRLANARLLRALPPCLPVRRTQRPPLQLSPLPGPPPPRASCAIFYVALAHVLSFVPICSHNGSGVSCSPLPTSSLERLSMGQACHPPTPTKGPHPV